MANPWMKKNPFLSMFLSGANAAAGRARGLSFQHAQRARATAVKRAAQTWMSLWTLPSGTKRKRSK